MFAATLLSVILIAQVSPAASPVSVPAMIIAPASEPTLDTGPCLDSPRGVPKVLQAPVDRSMQIVRIDKVVSTSTMTPGEIIGFLYSLGDGSTWLGQRTQQYMSASAATQINNVLSNTHIAGQNVSAFPPQFNHGVATHNTQFYKVQIPETAMTTLRIQLVPCIRWPIARTLPDPTM